MKKLLLTAVATLVCLGAFAQGKLSFAVDSTQLVFFTTQQSPTNGLAAGDVGKSVGGFSLAGSGLNTGANSTIGSLAGSPSIIAGLWAGTSAASLARVTTTTFGSVDFSGFLTAANVTLAGFPVGVPAFFQLQVYDAQFGSAAEAWAAGGKYGGQSPVFQMSPGAVYLPMYQTATPANSTMPVGTQVLSDYAGFPGYFGLVQVYATAVPEPGMFALAGLGAAVLMIFRRRK